MNNLIKILKFNDRFMWSIFYFSIIYTFIFVISVVISKFTINPNDFFDQEISFVSLSWIIYLNIILFSQLYSFIFTVYLMIKGNLYLRKKDYENYALFLEILTQKKQDRKYFFETSTFISFLRASKYLMWWNYFYFVLIILLLIGVKLDHANPFRNKIYNNEFYLGIYSYSITAAAIILVTLFFINTYFVTQIHFRKKRKIFNNLSIEAKNNLEIIRSDSYYQLIH